MSDKEPLILILSWVGPLLTGKIAKIVIYNKGRVNGGTNYDSPAPRWVPKLVAHKINQKLEILLEV